MQCAGTVYTLKLICYTIARSQVCMQLISPQTSPNIKGICHYHMINLQHVLVVSSSDTLDHSPELGTHPQWKRGVGFRKRAPRCINK